MGTGVSIMLSLPDSSFQVSSGHSKPDSSFSSFKLACLFGQALDLLVSVRLTCHHAYTPDLSTLSSLRGLTCLRNGKSHLEVGFTLRCLQRLSVPNLATRPCIWYATGTPEVRPSRSSRTKDSSSQISYAHNG